MELITTGAALVGAGTWFADKLLGPSADALGERLAVFAGTRLSTIFSKTRGKIGDASTEPLPPAFAYLAVQKASLSDDDETLTDMWSSLLAKAATNFESRHTLFSEILSQIGPQDASMFNRLYESVPDNRISLPRSVNLLDTVREVVENGCPQIDGSQQMAEVATWYMLNLELIWPGKIIYASVPFRDDGQGRSGTHGGGEGLRTEHEVLIRQQLLNHYSLSFRRVLPAPSFEVVLLTSLGVEFARACHGSPQ